MVFPSVCIEYEFELLSILKICSLLLIIVPLTDVSSTLKVGLEFPKPFGVV